MSNSLAIAAVTATLRNLLTPALTAHVSGTDVTTQPPDQARDDNTGNQVNLFLYQTELNPAWRNMPIPQQVRPGETGQPPLALNLFYLLTAYGQNNDDTLGHQLLGQAMRILHDHPVLSRSEIEAALTGNDLHEQVERVRITPQPMSLDEMSKLWNTFQTPYRISAAYQVAVVLIESRRPARTPLPVLTRGPDDEGVISQPNLEPPPPPFPTLTSVLPANGQPSAELGTELTIRGFNLAGADVSLRLAHPHLEDRFTIVDAITENTAEEIIVMLSDPGEPEPDMEAWPGPPGLYTVTAVVATDGEENTTNAAPFTLAPKITTVDASRDGDDVEVSVIFSPPVLKDQRVSLLFGNREIQIPTRSEDEPQSSFEVRVPDVAAGHYFVRLRVDGVDSLLIDRTITPPTFKESQRVTVS